ncbi:MAG: BamA/TamA family outer membrane protein, partial [Acidobacteriota bacterium]|nr:BamA/TamA family outer membrane protein [Acidobacteriota bacterium]
SITYEEGSGITRTEIEDRLAERDIDLHLGKPVDPGAIAGAEAIIRDLLGEKGFLDADVTSKITRVTERTRSVAFSISSGGKTRIRKIEFEGNELFSGRKLRSQLELTEERHWWWPWSGKNLYHPAKWDQDVSGVRQLYQNLGYLDVEIRAPVVTIIATDEEDDKKPKKKKREKPEADSAEDEPAVDVGSLSRSEAKKHARRQAKLEKNRRKQEKKEKAVKRWAYLKVPITEGPQYTLGTVQFEGNDGVFPDAILRRAIPIATGDIFRNDRVDAGVDSITTGYEDRGHLYATVVRRIDRDAENRVADVTISVEEDYPYLVSRIDYLGNSKTKDAVLRRETPLLEGGLFSRTRLEQTKRLVNRLGYYSVDGEPIIEPDEENRTVNVKFPGTEQGKNEIQVGGGFSGLNGAFFNGVYSTRNFLGRGQTLSTSIRLGGRSDQYQISFQEPWFLGRPYQLGFSLFRRDVDFGDTLQSKSSGGSLTLGKSLNRNSQISLQYNFQDVSSRTILTPAGGVGIGQVAEVIETSNKVSSVTPVYRFSTINNPFRPSGGKEFQAFFEVAGGPLGGDTNFLRPQIRYTHYHRGKRLRKAFLAFHGELGYVADWKDGSPNDQSAIGGVPRFRRFWLGGDTFGPRVFETRSITPLRYIEINPDGSIGEVLGDPRRLSPADLVSSNGVPVTVEVGGNRFYLLQGEYVRPLNEQAELAFFLDVGDTLFEDQSLGFDTMRVAAGVELRFYLPIFPVPLRLIWGVPIRDLVGDESTNFQFSIGRSF